MKRAGKLLVANLKMNFTNQRLAEYFAAFPPAPAGYPHSVVFCPSFTGLYFVRDKLRPPYYLGAQNMHYAEDGAYTGEISAAMLVEQGVQFVIIGHRERRFYNYEANHVLHEKIKTARAHGLQVILCVGEDEAQHNEGIAQTVLADQLRTTLKDLDDADGIYLAYEPTWAVGADHAAGTAEIAANVRFIHQICPYPVLYGGSVNPTNAGEILALPEIAGLLVGRASQNPATFAQICGLGDAQ